MQPRYGQDFVFLKRSSSFRHHRGRLSYAVKQAFYVMSDEKDEQNVKDSAKEYKCAWSAREDFFMREGRKSREYYAMPRLKHTAHPHSAIQVYREDHLSTTAYVEVYLYVFPRRLCFVEPYVIDEEQIGEIQDPEKSRKDDCKLLYYLQFNIQRLGVCPSVLNTLLF